MAKKTPEHWTTAQLEDALAARYPYTDGYALLFGVANATGWAANRTADALMHGLWVNRGKYFTGFEIKANRGDWLREIKQPDKAESVMKYCTYWYLVAGPDVVKLDEDPVPAPWGVLVPRGQKLYEVKKAEAMTPKPINNDFLASIMRAAFKERDKSKWVRAETVEQLVKERMDAEAKNQIEKIAFKRDQALEELKALKVSHGCITKVYANVGKLLGIELPPVGAYSDWERNRFLRMIRFLQDNRFDQTIDRIARAATMSGELATELNKFGAALKEMDSEDEDEGGNAPS